MSDDPYPAIIRSRWLSSRADLVYHEREPGEWCRYLDAEGKRHVEWTDSIVRWEIRTRCGLIVDGWTRDRDDNRGYVMLDDELADRIARPCRRCFDVVEAAA